MKTEAEILLENPELRRYRAMLYETPEDKFQIAFDCFAEDCNHAVEQAENAYPGCDATVCFPVAGF